MAVVQVPGNSYHIDNKLKLRWDRIKDGKLAEMDEDRVYIVDGREGCGKSVWTLQQAAYIDPTIVGDMDRICFSSRDVLEQVRKHRSTKEKTIVIIFDEAFRGLSSRSALSRINKEIIQQLMEMREKNLVLFIVSPSFFLIDLYAAMIRSNALFHISKKKGSQMRAFKMYSHKKKAILYQHGIKKGWEYKIYTRFRGRFSGKYPGAYDLKKSNNNQGKFEIEYRKKKRLAGINENAGRKAEIESKIQQDFNKIIKTIYARTKSTRKTANELKEMGVSRHYVTISKIVSEEPQ